MLTDTTLHQNRYVTAAEAAELLRVSERIVHSWTRQGKLTAFRIGKVTRIPVDDLEQFITEHTWVKGTNGVREHS